MKKTRLDGAILTVKKQTVMVSISGEVTMETELRPGMMTMAIAIV
ncbi:MAG: hypothetical protein ACLUQA_11365 [Faecalibacterium sp.]